jgi:mycoredoxin-dependent peroxiredoxin
MTVKIGQTAPNVELKSHLGTTIRLADFRGKQNVVIAFFPLAWTPV